MAADAARVSAAKAGAATRRNMGMWKPCSSTAQGGACWPEDWLNAAPQPASSKLPPPSVMPQFPAFFADGAGFGIEMA